MSKELALIFEYAKAPESLKAAGVNYRTTSAQLMRKEVALKALETEVAELRKKTAEFEKAFRAEINAWSPTGV